MDLFNRKALADIRERLTTAEHNLAITTQAFGSVEGELLAVIKDLDYEKERFAAVQLERETALHTAHELEVKNAVLTERLDLLTSGVLDAKPAPAAWTEDVEDAEFLFRTGRLDRGEFEAALEAAGFANTEIEFDSASLPLI